MTQCDGIYALRRLTELIHFNIFFGKHISPNLRVGQDRGKFKKTVFKITPLLYKSPNKFWMRFRLFGAGSMNSLLPSLFSCSYCRLLDPGNANSIRCLQRQWALEHLSLDEQMQLSHPLFRQPLSQNWPKSLNFIIYHYLFAIFSVLNLPHIYT